MNAGLAQGFVRFGTLAHFILLRAHEEKFVSNMSIRHRLMYDGQGFDKSGAAVAANLQRLVRYKFLFKVGRDRVYGKRSFAVFALDYRSGNGAPRYENVPATQRTKDYRERKKHKVNSVFNWRGQHESELSQ